MFTSEAQMETLIVNGLKYDPAFMFRVAGFPYGITRYVQRQVSLDIYGIADIVFGHLKTRKLVVLELKNVKADAKAFAQLARYMRGLSIAFSSRRMHNG